MRTAIESGMFENTERGWPCSQQAGEGTGERGFVLSEQVTVQHCTSTSCLGIVLISDFTPCMQGLVDQPDGGTGTTGRIWPT